MTITASQTGKEVTIVNDDPVATVVVNESFLQRGSRGIGSWVKRALLIGKNGQYSDTNVMIRTIRSHIVPIIIPNVVGLTHIEANALIIAKDLTLGTITNIDDPVLSQLPEAGTDAVYLDAVNLTMTP